MADGPVRVDTEELRERGFTVVRGFMDRGSCGRVREAMDALLGPERREVVPNRKLGDEDALDLGHSSQGGSGGWRHTIAHPNPTMAVCAHYMQKTVEAHCQILRSDPAHIRLNGQTLTRTDPGGADGPNYGAHVDNAFLSEHIDSTPREVYSRSIVALNPVRPGGAAFVCWPRSNNASRAIQGERDRGFRGLT